MVASAGSDRSAVICIRCGATTSAISICSNKPRRYYFTVEQYIEVYTASGAFLWINPSQILKEFSSITQLITSTA